MNYDDRLLCSEHSLPQDHVNGIRNDANWDSNEEEGLNGCAAFISAGFVVVSSKCLSLMGSVSFHAFNIMIFSGLSALYFHNLINGNIFFLIWVISFLLRLYIQTGIAWTARKLIRSHVNEDNEELLQNHNDKTAVWITTLVIFRIIGFVVFCMGIYLVTQIELKTEDDRNSRTLTVILLLLDGLLNVSLLGMFALSSSVVLFINFLARQKIKMQKSRAQRREAEEELMQQQQQQQINKKEICQNKTWPLTINRQLSTTTINASTTSASGGGIGDINNKHDMNFGGKTGSELNSMVTATHPFSIPSTSLIQTTSLASISPSISSVGHVKQGGDHLTKTPINLNSSSSNHSVLKEQKTNTSHSVTRMNVSPESLNNNILEVKNSNNIVENIIYASSSKGNRSILPLSNSLQSLNDINNCSDGADSNNSENINFDSKMISNEKRKSLLCPAGTFGVSLHSSPQAEIRMSEILTNVLLNQTLSNSPSNHHNKSINNNNSHSIASLRDETRPLTHVLSSAKSAEKLLMQQRANNSLAITTPHQHPYPSVTRRHSRTVSSPVHSSSNVFVNNKVSSGNVPNSRDDLVPLSPQALGYQPNSPSTISSRSHGANNSTNFIRQDSTQNSLYIDRGLSPFCLPENAPSLSQLPCRENSSSSSSSFSHTRSSSSQVPSTSVSQQKSRLVNLVTSYAAAAMGRTPSHVIPVASLDSQSSIQETNCPNHTALQRRLSVPFFLEEKSRLSSPRQVSRHHGSGQVSNGVDNFTSQHLSSVGQDLEQNLMCVFCGEILQNPNEVMVMLHCENGNHGSHENCLETWIQDHGEIKKSCPICNAQQKALKNGVC